MVVAGSSPYRAPRRNSEGDQQDSLYSWGGGHCAVLGGKTEAEKGNSECGKGVMVVVQAVWTN